MNMMRRIAAVALLACDTAAAKDDPPPSSFAPVVAKETFSAVKTRMTAEKAAIMKAHEDLLSQRYDLGDRPSESSKMSRGKAA